MEGARRRLWYWGAHPTYVDGAERRDQACRESEEVAQIIDPRHWQTTKMTHTVKVSECCSSGCNMHEVFDGVQH